MARLYSNENFPFPAVEELRCLGHDVMTIISLNPTISLSGVRSSWLTLVTNSALKRSASSAVLRAATSATLSRFRR